MEVVLWVYILLLSDLCDECVYSKIETRVETRFYCQNISEASDILCKNFHYSSVTFLPQQDHLVVDVDSCLASPTRSRELVLSGVRSHALMVTSDSVHTPTHHLLPFALID